jgi:hippurate hydrolase
VTGTVTGTPAGGAGADQDPGSSASQAARTALAGLDAALRERLADLYRDLHEHPELSFAETRTAGIVAQAAAELGYEVTPGVGRTGVVAVLRNGAGPNVLLRADFDALPVLEQTGLPYASKATGVDPDGRTVPVMHACGHDMHVACLLGAMELLAHSRSLWSGTLIAVFQPAEEVGEGARAMIADDFYARFGRPDVVLGQHVLPTPSGTIGGHAGPCFSGTDSMRVTMFGRGGHGAFPESAVDPVVMAAATVLRLQTVVSREVAASDSAVVTVGSIHAGTKDNIIPDDAEFTVNVRSFTAPVREKVLAGVRRVIKAESDASGAPRDPQYTPISTFPVLVNDEAATARTNGALRAALGGQRVLDPGVIPGSEDVGLFGTEAGVPVCYWIFGGADPAPFAGATTLEQLQSVVRGLPTNHSPLFAPVIEPTLSTGVSALTVAALAWLAAAAG